MSADIFISYRHGTTDSWVARLLFDRLESDFAVYYDTSRQSNDFGDDFAAGIDEALAACRVLFAVIGPNWTSPEGIRRLNEEKDWVRRELRIALERGESLRIVPLFVGGEKAPDFSGLPEDLRALGGKNGRTLNPDFWEVESQELVSRLKGDWLTVRKGSARTTAAMPPVLPYLCNRQEQEDRLVELLRTQSAPAPIACVVHGHKWEAHDEFLDRLRYQGALEDILNARDVGLAVHPLQLSHERLRDGRFRDALLSALKAGAMKRRAATDTELRAFLSTLSQPLVAVVQLIASDVGQDGASLEGLVSAWRVLAEGDAAGQPPMLPYPALLWINVTYEDDESVDLGPGVVSVSLPRLQPVGTVHVREWLGLDDVKQRVGEKKYEIEDLPAQARYYIEPGRMHMRRFADGVREIMSRP